MSRNLFKQKTFTMHSGDIGHWKIECDSLTDEDIDTLAYMIGMKFDFTKVVGVPTGGLRISKALEKYTRTCESVLVVDDVLTTGNSMEKVRYECYHKGAHDVLGVVLFARGECPGWITPLFQIPKRFR